MSKVLNSCCEMEFMRLTLSASVKDEKVVPVIMNLDGSVDPFKAFDEVGVIMRS